MPMPMPMPMPLLPHRPLSFFGLVVVLLASARVAEARSFRVGQVPNGERFDCTLCHVGFGGGPRNRFGADVESRLIPTTRPISQRDVNWSDLFGLDSDRDGATNGEELGDPDGDGQPEPGVVPTHPGDAQSFPAPDLIVTVTGSPDPVLAGSLLAYTVRVRNAGSRPASGVALAITLPEGTTLKSADPLCGSDAGGLSCKLGDVAPGTTVTVDLDVAVGGGTGGVLILEAVATAEETDIDAANNRATEETTAVIPAVRSPFYRGDPNDDGTADLSDGIGIFQFLFLGGAEPRCLESADTNNDGMVDITDGIFLLENLFLGGPEPPPPGRPGSSDCGEDPDAPGSPGDLGCEEYVHCGA